MREHQTKLASTPVRIHVLETADDVSEFRQWWMRPTGVIGLDTETTGLDIYSPGWGLRLVQFGDGSNGWVLQADQFADVIRGALRDQRKRFGIHNAAFDLLVLDRALGVTVEELSPRVTDTQILSHLADPRGRAEGGVGQHLKDLAQAYLDPSASDGQKELLGEFRKIGETKDTGWAKIAIDNPVYELYAGLDPVLVARMLPRLLDMVDRSNTSHLIDFEHRVMRILAQQQRRGVRVDVDYTRQLSSELLTEYEEHVEKARAMGVANINSTVQLAAELEKYETIPERTKSGKVQVNADVLLRIAGWNKDWEEISSEGNPLAQHVLLAKRADKWRKSYVEQFLDLMDGESRIHPSIRGLAARTGRMSISNPPLQQLPSSDWKIRRCLVADPGNVFVGVDFQAQEMSCLAVMCQDTALVQAIRDGVDLHSHTAELMFGPGFTKKHRALAKMSGFARVYGGGAGVIAKQSGEDIEVAQKAVRAYDNAYPGIGGLKARLDSEIARNGGAVYSYTGRRLPVDEDRSYAATNFVCQSLGRDITAEALVQLDAAGLGDMMVFPVHDEVLFNVPASDADEVRRQAEQIMATEIEGVPFRTEGTVGKQSWGSLKGADE